MSLFTFKLIVLYLLLHVIIYSANIVLLIILVKIVFFCLFDFLNVRVYNGIKY